MNDKKTTVGSNLSLHLIRQSVFLTHPTIYATKRSLSPVFNDVFTVFYLGCMVRNHGHLFGHGVKSRWHSNWGSL